jgi:riboflavin synthase
MFTGIIEAVGRVEAAEQRHGASRLRIAAPFAGDLKVDDSVAVDGVCLTVVERTDSFFEADVVAETLAKTNLDRLAEGEEVNLERSLEAGARLHGHIVQGHVDARGEVADVDTGGGSTLVTVRYPRHFAAYLIPVGSVALDGISFTVARLGDETLTVAVIPHTWEHTTIRSWEAGRKVNLEFDLIGKYVVRAIQQGVGEGVDAARRFLTG